MYIDFTCLFVADPGYVAFECIKNIVFPARAEYSYFSADVRLKIFL